MSIDLKSKPLKSHLWLCQSSFLDKLINGLTGKQLWLPKVLTDKGMGLTPTKS